jgi:hypothetical protein
MEPSKAIDRKNGPNAAVPDPTLWTFVRAASVANLLVATIVLVDFIALAVSNHDGKAFYMGLWLVPFVTLVIWGTSAVLFVGASTPKWLRMLGRRLSGTSRYFQSGRSGVWDHWLDSPEPHGP